MSCADGTAPEDDGEAPGSGLASICVSNLALWLSRNYVRT